MIVSHDRIVGGLVDVNDGLRNVVDAPIHVHEPLRLGCVGGCIHIVEKIGRRGGMSHCRGQRLDRTGGRRVGRDCVLRGDHGIEGIGGLVRDEVAVFVLDCIAGFSEEVVGLAEGGIDEIGSRRRLVNDVQRHQPPLGILVAGKTAAQLLVKAHRGDMEPAARELGGGELPPGGLEFDGAVLEAYQPARVAGRRALLVCLEVSLGRRESRLQGRAATVPTALERHSCTPSGLPWLDKAAAAR